MSSRTERTADASGQPNLLGGDRHLNLLLVSCGAIGGNEQLDAIAAASGSASAASARTPGPASLLGAFDDHRALDGLVADDADDE